MKATEGNAMGFIDNSLVSNLNKKVFFESFTNDCD